MAILSVAQPSLAWLLKNIINNIIQVKSMNLKPKILIIDDEISFLTIFGTALGNAGFEIKTYTDPSEALKEIESENPDLILLDISMPGMDGFAFFDQLKEKFGKKNPKVVFLTNLGESVAGTSVDEHFAKNIGAAGYIHKTDDLNNVIKKINDVIKGE